MSPGRNGLAVKIVIELLHVYVYIHFSQTDVIQPHRTVFSATSVPSEINEEPQVNDALKYKHISPNVVKQFTTKR